ncbi:MAG: leucine-rich repeat domain-containing protein [Alistipes sp.]|nr:leucine-rich repeat domain-containing protein [Alistipes sp.]
MSLIEDGLGDAADDEVGGTLVSAEDYVTTVALNCGDGVALDTETVTDFYLVLPPQTFRKGITVKVTCTDGTVVEKSTTSPLTISRNTIQPMATLTINGKPTEPASNEIWYTSTDGNIVEPLRTNITGFGANIISNTYENGKGVITFDGEVTKIGDSAFEDCSGLTSVTIPDSVTEIGKRAFSDCSGLTSVTIPNSVTEIGNNPFRVCENLAEFKGKFASEDGRCLIVDGILKSFAPFGITTYNIPDGVTEIGYSAFSWCDSLTSITIPDSVTDIGDWAFYSCDGLTSITIPDSVTSIGEWAFSYCRSLTSITIPDSVTEIGYRAFLDCGNLAEFKGKFASEDGRCLIIDGVLNSFASAGLTQYTIPDGVTEIGDHAFQGCDGLTSITIPDSVTSIGDWAFQYCSGLTSITIPNNVTTIGSGAFGFCAGLTSITIPNSVTKIGEMAFYECSGLTSITIPDSVTEISNHAFYGCSGLTSITIPNSVTKVSYYAFYDCSGLTSVFCERTTPPTADFYNDSWYAFKNNATGRKIYVPTESVDAYKAADGWKEYADAIEPYDFSAVSE